MVRVGILEAPQHGQFSAWAAAPGWEDVDVWTKVDTGAFYAGKDGAFPRSLGAGADAVRRINWGWVRPHNTFTLPREVTFNAAARQLEWAPLPELQQLRGAPVASLPRTELNGTSCLLLTDQGGNASWAKATFALGSGSATLGLGVNAGADGRGGAILSVDYVPPPKDAGGPPSYYEVATSLGESLRLLPSEKTLTVDVFVDGFIIEAYFQNGRLARTLTASAASPRGVTVVASKATATLERATVWSMNSIWVTKEDVLATPRMDEASLQV